MDALKLYKTDITAYDGTPVRLAYDQEGDILDIFFGANEPATGVDLTDHIILRLNQQTKRAISLMLIDFSILTERTEYGPHSYPLDKLHDLPDDLRELALQLVTSMPVSQFIKVPHFQASPTECLLLTYVESQPSVHVV